MALKKGEYYWYRMGDGDDYHSTKKLRKLKDNITFGKLIHIRKYGIETTDYQGMNYISLFIGDKDAQPIKDIPKSTIKKLFR